MGVHSDAIRRVRIVYSGRVQGVGFRWNVCELAADIGLTGWVKNEFDGTVTCELQGSSAQISEFYGLLPERFASYPIPVNFRIADTDELEYLPDETRFKIKH